jgi:hypothetical protein
VINASLGQQAAGLGFAVGVDHDPAWNGTNRAFKHAGVKIKDEDLNPMGF